MKGFLTGLGVGVTLGCAFAPAAGRETRKRISDIAHRMSEQSHSRLQPQSASTETPKETHQFMDSFQPQDIQEQNRSSLDAPDSATDEVTQILNTASKTTLRSVRGIGDATARRIVEHRPYDTEDAVLKNKVLSQDTLEELKDTLVDKDKEVA